MTSAPGRLYAFSDSYSIVQATAQTFSQIVGNGQADPIPLTGSGITYADVNYRASDSEELTLNTVGSTYSSRTYGCAMIIGIGWPTDVVVDFDAVSHHEGQVGANAIAYDVAEESVSMKHSVPQIAAAVRRVPKFRGTQEIARGTLSAYMSAMRMGHGPRHSGGTEPSTSSGSHVVRTTQPTPDADTINAGVEPLDLPNSVRVASAAAGAVAGGARLYRILDTAAGQILERIGGDHAAGAAIAGFEVV